MHSKQLSFLPAAGKPLAGCCAGSEGGKRKMSVQRTGPAAASALVAKRTTAGKKETKLTSCKKNLNHCSVTELLHPNA